MNIPRYTFYVLLISAAAFVSCDKGYDVRFTNYYTEPMDSLVIGDNQIVFKDVAPENTTGFEHVTRGKHSLKFVTRSKKRFYSVMTIPSKGSGKRTVQIDAIRQIAVLEE